MFDLEDHNDDFGASPLDKERLLYLEDNETMNAESGLWTVTKYPNEYVLIFTSAQRQDMLEFKTVGEITYFLSEMS